MTEKSFKLGEAVVTKMVDTYSIFVEEEQFPGTGSTAYFSDDEFKTFIKQCQELLNG